MNFYTAIDPNQLEVRDAIARWVKEAGDRVESQGLEVKSTLGFTTGGERNQSFVKIIKFILGAANRDEFKAVRDFSGYGIMLIGISKGEVHGVENVPEQHPFEDFAKAYFGTAVPSYYRFVPHAFEGKTLLFVLVDPPVNGREIYICAKNYQAQEKKGQIGSQTAPCTTATPPKPNSQTPCSCAISSTDCWAVTPASS